MTEYFPVFQSLLIFTSPVHVTHTQKVRNVHCNRHNSDKQHLIPAEYLTGTMEPIMQRLPVGKLDET
jgi:hypothetical protein